MQSRRLEGWLERKNKEVQHDLEFYEAQIEQVREDNAKLVETYEILDERTAEVEQEVGFRHVYD